MADGDQGGAVGGVAGATGPAQPHTQDAQDVPHDATHVQNANATQNVRPNVQNADINVKLGDGRTLIFSTLLTFCVSAMSNALKMNVVQLIVLKFSDDEVVAAKNILCKNSDNLLQYQSRKDSPYRSEKFVHTEDIYDGVKKLSDANKLPLFVTDGHGLCRLPKIDAEDITNVSIAEKIASFERKFATFDESMTSILLKSLDNSDRISAIETGKMLNTPQPSEPSQHGSKMSTMPSENHAKSTYTAVSNRTTSGAAVASTSAVHPQVTSSVSISATATTPAAAATTLAAVATTHAAAATAPATAATTPAVVNLSRDKAVPMTEHNTLVSQSTNNNPVSTASTMSAKQTSRTMSNAGTGAYSTVLMSPRHSMPPMQSGVQLDDVQFPTLPASSQSQLPALHHVTGSASAGGASGGSTTHVTGNGGQNSSDGFRTAHLNKLARRVSSMTITGKAKGGQLRAAAPPTEDVFACRLHRDTTEEELCSYLYSKDIMPKSIELVSHIDARTRSFRICCDRTNFVKCFDEDLWPDEVVIRKYVPPRRTGRLFDKSH